MNYIVQIIILLLLNIATTAQVITSTGKIILPDVGNTKVINSGENITYRSATEIELQPELTIENGATVIFEIGDVAPPVDKSYLNWRLARVFGANGSITSESKAFYDNFGAPTQALTRNITNSQVLGSQIIYDYLGRPVIKTLQAPIGSTLLDYKKDFVQGASGNIYNPANFDDAKLNNPDPLGNTVPGTLGWYYSNNNTQERFVAASGYPYTRVDFYNDGTGEAKRNAGVGEVLMINSGHESRGYSSPVANELEHYLGIRNKFFTTAELGELPSVKLVAPAQLSIVQNPNGQEQINISDGEGKVLMSARPGNDLVVKNTFEFSTSGIYYFKLFQPTAVSYNADYVMTLFDMSGNEQAIAFPNGGILPAGYYKAVSGNKTGAGTLPPSVSYNIGFTDISYIYYNQLGQTVATIAPEGVKKLVGAGINNYAQRSQIPFMTQYEYNMKGQMVSSTNFESGTKEIVYTSKGKMRFSQNSLQRNEGKYNYFNYDALGRIVEYGEFTPAANGIAFSKTGMPNVEDRTAAGNLGNGTRSQWVKTTFDMPVATGIAGYTQDDIYLNRNISFTENESGAKTWFNYDEQGLVIWEVLEIPGLGKKTVDFVYNGNGKVKEKIYQKNIAGETFVHFFELDPDQRLSAVYTNTTYDAATKKLQAKYQYYPHGPLKRIEIGGNVQGIDLTYTIEGALKTINNSNKDGDPGQDGISGTNAAFAKDAFGMNLEYYSGDYTRSNTNISGIQVDGTLAPDRFNGEAKAMSWYSRKPSSILATQGVAMENPVMYAYKYNNRSQLENAVWGTPSFNGTPTFTASSLFNEKILSYDANGNINGLQRTNATGILEDNFTYNYISNTNRLQNVVNGASVYDSYTYDAIGRVSSESIAGGPARYYKYNVGGKVLGIYTDAGFQQPRVTFTYNERGQRIIKKDWVNNTSTYYVVDMNGKPLATYMQTGAATPVEEELPVYGDTRIGLLRKSSGIYEYELQDHLGNVRAVIDGNRNIKSYSDYYPFGMIARDGGSKDYRYGYQGQNSEFDPETKLNAFDLRLYDARIGRWLTIDPESQYYSPYLAMGNNPVCRTDNTGGADNGPGDQWVNPWKGNWLKPVDVTAKRGDTYKGFPRTYYDNAHKDYYRGSWRAFQDAVRSQKKSFDFIQGPFATLVTTAPGFIGGGQAAIGQRILIQRAEASTTTALITTTASETAAATLTASEAAAVTAEAPIITGAAKYVFPSGDELLNLGIAQGKEILGGYVLLGVSRAVVNETYYVAVLSLGKVEGAVLTSTAVETLLPAFEREGIALGAKRIIIYGAAVHNEAIASPRAWRLLTDYWFIGRMEEGILVTKSL